MVKNRRSLTRPQGQRRYKRMYILAVEGAVTEIQYFNILNNENIVVHIHCLRGNHKSAPKNVLERMEKYLNINELNDNDQAWLVVDKDQWTDGQLNELFQWSQQKDNYGFALSNPKFEYWLLLHFEDGNGVSNSRQCTDKLKLHLPDYQKHINPREFTIDKIKRAIQRAKIKDNPPCSDWPRSTGTTVYRLVEQIMKC